MGGDSANLGALTGLDVPVLPGFSRTFTAYDHFLEESGARSDLEKILNGLDPEDIADLQRRGAESRRRLSGASMPPDLEDRLDEAYRELADRLDVGDPAVAVRSSATAEDLPTVSFAGQRETFLNVTWESGTSSRTGFDRFRHNSRSRIVVSSVCVTVSSPSLIRTSYLSGFRTRR
ncbi:PEP/pyruvate-binding domain-containing protein [Halomontanus rarus]|uniref:PEP/pyruvate-binding domain-containing protein n=1 Tax=Halomontanus rarus TaxID=3034020 RepID=UPI0023E8DBC5|nr:PEP/pyruvate-binding domain-containing protein [Halovivax sp. TS33]